MGKCTDAKLAFARERQEAWGALSASRPQQVLALLLTIRAWGLRWGSKSSSFNPPFWCTDLFCPEEEDSER